MYMYLGNMYFRRKPKVQTQSEGTVEQIIIKINEKTNEKQNEKEIEKHIRKHSSTQNMGDIVLRNVCVLCSIHITLYNEDIVTSPKERNQLVCMYVCILYCTFPSQFNYL